MRKHNLKKLFKTGTLIFGIFLLLTTCQKEDTITKGEILESPEIQFQPTIKTIYNKQVNETFTSLKNQYHLDPHLSNQTESNELSKNSSQNQDITIHDDVIKEITLGNYSSYTMRVTFSNVKTSSIYNLTIEDNNGSTGMFVTKYTPIQNSTTSKTTTSKGTGSTAMGITTQRITEIDYYNPNEDTITENPPSGGGSGSPSETYPYDCDGEVVTTSVIQETYCGCGDSWDDLMNGICIGCNTNSPRFPSINTVNVYECIPYDYGNESDTGNPTGGGDSSTTDTETPSITTPIGLDGTKVTENYIISELNIVDAKTINWIYNESNSQVVLNIYGFLISNNNNNTVEAKDFAIQAIKLDMVLSSEHKVVNTNKLPEELDPCCPGDCCPDVDLYMNDRIVHEYGIQPVVALIDGSFNLIMGTSELIGSDAWVGSRIRKMMLEIGIDVPTDIDNEHLSELYRIRKRDNVVIIEYRPGLLKSMLDVGLDTLDVLAFLSPAKGGGPILFAKMGGSVSITSISKHIRDITVTSVKIENALNNLKSKAKYVLEGTGEFKTVGGHHPLAKIAFNSDKFYDLQKAFSVSKAKLDEVSGITDIHFQITGQQNSLYSAFAKTGEVLTIEKMANIEIKAMTNVGIPEDVATGWVVKALEDLKIQGVKVITNIPWNGLN